MSRLSPDEAKETLGIKSPIEREMQQAQLKNLQEEGPLKREELEVRKQEIQRALDQFSVNHDLAERNYKLNVDAKQAVYDERAIDNYTKTWDGLQGKLAGMSDKKVVGDALEAFFQLHSSDITNPGITNFQAVRLGSSMIYNTIRLAQEKGLDPERLARLQMLAAQMQKDLRVRALTPDPSTGQPDPNLTGMLAGQQQALKVLTAPKAKPWYNIENLGPWGSLGVETGLGLGGLYGGKKAWNWLKNRGNAPVPTNTPIGEQGTLFDLPQASKGRLANYASKIGNIFRGGGIKSLGPLGAALAAGGMSQEAGNAPGAGPMFMLAPEYPTTGNIWDENKKEIF